MFWWKQDRRIEELTVLLGQYRKMREVMALTQGKDSEFVRLLPLSSLCLILIFVVRKQRGGAKWQLEAQSHHTQSTLGHAQIRGERITVHLKHV